MGKKRNYGIAIGTRFWSLTTISEQFYGDDRIHKNIARVRCKCDCGKEVEVNCYELTSGTRKSCGCKQGIPRAEYGRWTCRRCGIIFNTRRELFAHSKYVHNSDGRAWAKGRTKENDPIMKHHSDVMKRKIASGEYVNYYKGKKLSEEHRKKISEGMKRAHSEGRAHNIGMCRWNNKPSYPESFFMRAIENNFSDKGYIREYPFFRFSLDFAWVDKKKCIEIDGAQHERFEDYKERDRKKDELLRKKGWNVLRIKWKDMFDSPQIWIETARKFIDES